MHTIICAVHMAVDGANIGVVPLTNVNQCYRSHSLLPVVYTICKTELEICLSFKKFINTFNQILKYAVCVRCENATFNEL